MAILWCIIIENDWIQEYTKASKVFKTWIKIYINEKQLINRGPYTIALHIERFIEGQVKSVRLCK